MTDNKIQELFDNCKNSAEITFVRGEGKDCYPCIIISWSEKGRGFGEYTFYYSKEDGQWVIDSETDSKEAVKRVLGTLVDSLPLDGETTEEE